MARKTETAIDFQLVDVTAKDDSRISVSDRQPFINLEELKEEELKGNSYATLELNQFLLNGKMEAMPENLRGCQFGWWSSQMSDDRGNFAAPPVMTVTFEKSHSSMGLTFRFLEATADYPGRMNIRWYDGEENLLAEEEFYPDQALFFAHKVVFQYKKIVITFSETCKPYRYVKLTEIMYGAYFHFGEEQLVNASLIEEIDPTSAQVSINTLNFRFHDPQGRFSLLDTDGGFALFQRRQKVRVRSYLNDEELYMGTYYLERPTAENENVTDMQCIDVLGVLDQTEFMGGMYENVTAEAILSEIMQSAKCGFRLDEELKSFRLSGWIPVSSHKEALQQVAFALGAAVDTSRTEGVNIYRVKMENPIAVEKGRKIIGHQVSQLALVTGVEVTAYQYVAETDRSKQQELQNSILEAGEHTILFHSPMHSLSVTGASIVESGANYAVLQVETERNVILDGLPYLETKTVHGVYDPDLPGSELPNVKLVDGGTLISPDLGPPTAQRLYDYYQLRYEDSGEILLEAEKAGAWAALESMGDRRLEGFIEALDIDLTGGLTGKMELTGKVER